MGNSNTASSIISHTTVISIAYLASPDSSGSLGIINYFLRWKYSVGKGSEKVKVIYVSVELRCVVQIQILTLLWLGR